MGCLMKPAFLNDEIWRVFQVEIKTWEGTPWRWLQQVKGAGVDCTGYIAESLVSTGFVTKFEYPKTGSSWYLNSKHEYIIESFEKAFADYGNPCFEWKFIENPKYFLRGDILFFKIIRKIDKYHHSNFYLGEGKMLHCVEGKTVHVINFDSRWMRKCQAVFRVYEKGT